MCLHNKKSFSNYYMAEVIIQMDSLSNSSLVRGVILSGATTRSWAMTTLHYQWEKPFHRVCAQAQSPILIIFTSRISGRGNILGPVCLTALKWLYHWTYRPEIWHFRNGTALQKRNWGMNTVSGGERQVHQRWGFFTGDCNQLGG